MSTPVSLPQRAYFGGRQHKTAEDIEAQPPVIDDDSKWKKPNWCTEKNFLFILIGLLVFGLLLMLMLLANSAIPEAHPELVQSPAQRNSTAPFCIQSAGQGPEEDRLNATVNRLTVQTMLQTTAGRSAVEEAAFLKYASDYASGAEQVAEKCRS
ncbi:hypothetical protein N7490_007620 [Penicillium lividum]|nr:hypothetical protein N7490_007620 [Penicillium lividum]